MKMFKKAILIIHGFAGGVYDQEDLAINLELNNNFDVFTFTLPGHDVKDAKKSTSKLWIEESEKNLNKLIDSGYKKIYLVGHSMGGVIASYLASKYKEVKKVVLAAPAFTSFASKEEGGFLNILKKGAKIIQTYDWNEFVTRSNKLPTSSVKEFFKLVDTYKKSVYDIKIPIMLVHGNKDNIVPISMSKEVYEKLNTKKFFLIVKGSHHDLFKGNKKELVIKEVINFLEKSDFFIKNSFKEI